tara:strand:+ start:10503 stop:10925 length:423 start_codon:yes stop_codon:yes gene_type:complete
MKYAIKFIVTVCSLSFLLLSCNAINKQKNTLSTNGSSMETASLKVDEKEDIHKISNNEASASFKVKGAEMISFRTNNLEYIWQADPEVWPRHAPLLFPIVGQLKDKEYIYKGQTYPMKQHGFARDNDFKVVEKNRNQHYF